MRFLGSDGLAVYDRDGITSGGDVFGVHDAIMEHGCGKGQQGGVIIRQAPVGMTAGWQADLHKAVSWTCWAGVRGLP